MGIKELVKAHMSPELKKCSFKKYGNTWVRQLVGARQVVNVQTSRLNADDHERFTINFGVLFPEIWETCWQKELPKAVREDDCFPRLRIGEVLDFSMQKKRDIWWELNQEDDIDLVGEKIGSLLKDKCLPFLDKMSTETDVINLLSSTEITLQPIEKIYFAIIKIRNGKQKEAIMLLDEVSNISSEWAELVENVTARII
ncbi:DUF4304 domain-containing protein (plasmid) [Microbulbifer sp. MKSA007]|nr:DUF4304 domain-containing protein [Microbulbifer sp. MKSA007]